MIDNVVIVDAVRSAVGRAHKGALAQTRPDELAGQVVAALMARVPKVKPADVEDLVRGLLYVLLPLGVVAHRHRFRALVAASVAVCLVSFLVAGTGTFSNVVECTVVGGLVGIGRRRNCPKPDFSASSRALGSPIAAPSPAPFAASDCVMQ